MSQSELPLSASFNSAPFDSTFPWSWLVRCFCLWGSIRFCSYDKANALTLSSAAVFSGPFLGCSETFAASFGMPPEGCIQLSVHRWVCSFIVHCRVALSSWTVLERSFTFFWENELYCVVCSSCGLSWPCPQIEFLGVKSKDAHMYSFRLAHMDFLYQVLFCSHSVWLPVSSSLVKCFILWYFSVGKIR